MRRVFATAAEAADIPHVALKQLLNHATATDVTAGYVRTDLDTLRGFSQRVCDYLLSLTEEQDGKVVPIGTAAKR